MKLLFGLLGCAALMLVIGGLGAVAKDTYPAVVPLAATTANTGATAGNPLLLIVCVGAVVVGLALGIGRR